MNYETVFVTLLLIALVAPVTLVVVKSAESGAHFVALVLARMFVMAAGAVLVVVTVPLLSSPGPGFDGNAMGSFVGALVVSAICLACERHVVLREASNA